MTDRNFALCAIATGLLLQATVFPPGQFGGQFGSMWTFSHDNIAGGPPPYYEGPEFEAELPGPPPPDPSHPESYIPAVTPGPYSHYSW